MGGGDGIRASHHNFVVFAPMIMKFGTGIKFDLFYTMVTVFWTVFFLFLFLSRTIFQYKDYTVLFTTVTMLQSYIVLLLMRYSQVMQTIRLYHILSFQLFHLRGNVF